MTKTEIKNHTTETLGGFVYSDPSGDFSIGAETMDELYSKVAAFFNPSTETETEA